MSNEIKVVKFEVAGTGYELRFYPTTHRYRVKGGQFEKFTQLPSVTTVGKALSGFDGGRGMAYARNQISERLHAATGQVVTAAMAEQILDGAADHRDGAASRGDVIHQWLEHYCATGNSLSNAYPIACAALQRWLDEWLIEPVLIEQPVCNLSRVPFAGMLDLLARYTDPDTGKSGLGMFDLKTGKGVYPNHWTQLAAYQDAVEWMGLAEGDIDGRFIMHLPQEREDRVVTLRAKLPYLDDLTAFRLAAGIHAWKAETRRVAKGAA